MSATVHADDDLGLVEAVDGFGESIDAPMSVKN
jgi:hypothetical protein